VISIRKSCFLALMVRTLYPEYLIISNLEYQNLFGVELETSY